MKITPDNARLTTDWFGVGANVYSGCLMLNGLDIAHVHMHAPQDGPVTVTAQIVQPGDEEQSRKYQEVEIGLTPWDDMEDKQPQPPLTITHTFAVPRQNLGGSNHGAHQWLADVLDSAGLVEQDFAVCTSGPIDDTYRVTVTAPERTLRFLCVLFDLHAHQSPSDETDPAEAAKLEHAIQLAKVEAMPPSPERARRLYELRGWLTVGQLRDALANEPADKLVTIYNGDWYEHATIVNHPASSGEQEPTVILAMTGTFDTRDI